MKESLEGFTDVPLPVPKRKKHKKHIKLCPECGHAVCHCFADYNKGKEL